MITDTDVMNALRRVNDPEIGRNLVELNMIHDLKIAADGKVDFTIALTVPACPLREQMRGDAQAAVSALPGVTGVEIAFRSMTEAERRVAFGMSQAPALPQLSNLNQVRQVIAILSGKGGVGKTLVTAGLALALRRS